ncbi:FO synthase [Gordonia pseudamarae]|uniref:FO synthase n=1 Tax=Gordonia pseudamarae TaxID=2831662 RepID=A0ABX6IL31_9ACTN|nr:MULTISPECIES: FO synthase [Gordonia]MBD0023019.1 FO synthase [Gordonia sp. (in: high G+C Gram-positive bacteria)]QHN27161.1 FO synthase [Gordonia pseudamarae]QHN36051.1 FO synthase [Gordonia pseudamarae]
MVLRAWARDVVAETSDVRAALRRVSADPTSPTDDDWAALLGADGDELDELCAVADSARRSVTDPDALTFVVNRNVDTAVIAAGGPDVPDLAELVGEAWRLGATEICMQGPLPADAPADGYLRLIEQVHRAAPEIHLHAFRPPEVRDGATRMDMPVAAFLGAARDAGLGSVPGTAAQILDDQVRARLSGGSAPPVSEWVETIEAAHDVGLFSTSTLLYGHVESPRHVVAHLRLLNEIQERTNGFSELIVMPMLPSAAPAYLGARGVASRRETRAVHAVARLLTFGRIAHLQVAWTKLDPDSVLDVLRGGADDIGGLLLDGVLMPEAGQEAGRVLSAREVADIAARVGRTPVQRTTGYGAPSAALLTPIPQVHGR